MTSLHRIDLILNIQKTKILQCIPSMDESTLNFGEIGDGIMKVLRDNESQRYLGRLLSISASNRSYTEFLNRVRASWTVFQNHKSGLLKYQLSIKLRLKYFDACLGPTLLFDTAELPLSKLQYLEFDSIECESDKNMLLVNSYSSLHEELIKGVIVEKEKLGL